MYKYYNTEVICSCPV